MTTPIAASSPWALAGSRRRRRRRASWPRSTTATRAPSSANRWAVARPMPLAAPVTSARLPSIDRDSEVNRMAPTIRGTRDGDPDRARPTRPGRESRPRSSELPPQGSRTCRERPGGCYGLAARRAEAHAVRARPPARNCYPRVTSSAAIAMRTMRRRADPADARGTAAEPDAVRAATPTPPTVDGRAARPSRGHRTRRRRLRGDTERTAQGRTS